MDPIRNSTPDANDALRHSATMPSYGTADDDKHTMHGERNLSFYYGREEKVDDDGIEQRRHTEAANGLDRPRISLVTSSMGYSLPGRRTLSARILGRNIGWSGQLSTPIADRQVNQMRIGFSLGLEGLERYNTSLNILLVFVPLGILAKLLNIDDAIVFILCFIGMIPLATHLSKATEDIAEKTNDTLGALVNVTFGNAVEIILSISALRAGRLALIQNTLIGSILSNLLLVLGSAFLWGGYWYTEQTVTRTVSEANSDMLAFAVFSLSIPAIFALAIPQNSGKQVVEERMSLVTSICLLVIYCLYMFFQLYTSENLDTEDIADSDDASFDQSSTGEAPPKEISLAVALGVLFATVLLVSVLSEFIVDSIDGFSRRAGLGEKFIAVILLPVIGNAVEHLSAILVAGHNKIDLAIGIACGSSVQIALFAAPIMVVISWFLTGPRLTLNFHVFETVCVAFSVFVVNATLGDSRSNWLEGAVLVMCYVIVAAAFYFMN